MKMKYVRVQGYGFILWPHSDLIHHRHVAMLVGREGSVISAGFCTVEGDLKKVTCYGRSESLNIGILAGDSIELCNQLGF